MTIHKLVFIPDPRLRKQSQPVVEIDSALQTLIDDMFETMYHARGVGLAAPQIGINIRLAVIDVTADKSQQLVLINPEIVEKRDIELMEEGCLSVPGTAEKVQRATYVKMRATNRQGKEYELVGEGLLAEAMQHEIDHLDGKLYFDTLSSLKRDRIKKKVEKFLRS